MVSLLILTEFVILYVLVIVTRRMPVMFRLFLGLIITWPVLSLYLQIDLPAGVPDIQYSRAYVGGLLLCVLISAAVRQRFRRPVAANGLFPVGPKGHPASETKPTPSGEAEAPTRPEPSIPALSNGSPEFASRRRRSLENPATARGEIAEADTYRGDMSGIPMVVIAYVGLMGVSVISSLMTGGAASTVIAAYLDATLLPLAIYYLTRKYVDSRQRLVWLLSAFILSVLITCLTGLYENTLDLTHSPFPIAPINEEGDTRWLGVPGGRAAGVLENPAIYGGVMGMGMLCCFAFLVHTRGWGRRWLLGGVVLILAYGVFVSYTRSAWVSVAIALLFAQFFLNGLWKVAMPLLILGTLVLGLMWGALKQNDLVQDRVLDKENVTGRIERMTWSWERFLERPVFGRGLGALDEMMQHVFQEDFDTSHNTYLTMLVDVGVVRFALFAAVVLVWLSKASAVLRSRLRGQFEYSVVAAMVGVMMIWLLSGLSIELRLFPYFAALFWMSGAIIERLNAHVVSSQSWGKELRRPWFGSRRSQVQTAFAERRVQLGG